MKHNLLATVNRTFAIATVLVVAMSIMTSAHSGRTDSNGGHYNRSTGEYHYHHGYPAHSHPGGKCPYTYSQNSQKDNTESVYETSGGSKYQSAIDKVREEINSEKTSSKYQSAIDKVREEINSEKTEAEKQREYYYGLAEKRKELAKKTPLEYDSLKQFADQWKDNSN